MWRVSVVGGSSIRDRECHENLVSLQAHDQFLHLAGIVGGPGLQGRVWLESGCEEVNPGPGKHLRGDVYSPSMSQKVNERYRYKVFRLIYDRNLTAALHIEHLMFSIPSELLVRGI